MGRNFPLNLGAGLAPKYPMSAKSLAKYPQGSILRDIRHPCFATGACAVLLTMTGFRNGDRCLSYAKTLSLAGG
jgi:hypothetical protein